MDKKRAKYISIGLTALAVALAGVFGAVMAGIEGNRDALVFVAQSAEPKAAAAEPSVPAIETQPPTEQAPQPSAPPSADPTAPPAQTSETSGLININTADKETLMTLKGIGEVIAGNIIEYRETTGGFRNIEEIMNVPRIGEKTFEKLRGFITAE